MEGPKIKLHFIDQLLSRFFNLVIKILSRKELVGLDSGSGTSTTPDQQLGKKGIKDLCERLLHKIIFSSYSFALIAGLTKDIQKLGMTFLK